MTAGEFPGVGTLSGLGGNFGHVRGGATRTAGGFANNCAMGEGAGFSICVGGGVVGAAETIGGTTVDVDAEAGNGCAETIGAWD